MRPTEIKDLVAGLLVVIFIAMAIGQYGRLERFARDQAKASLRGWPEHRFFPVGYEYHGPKKAVVHEHR